MVYFYFKRSITYLPSSMLYTFPPMVHLLNSIMLQVSVPVLSDNTYFIIPNSSFKFEVLAIAQMSFSSYTIFTSLLMKPAYCEREKKIIVKQTILYFLRSTYLNYSQDISSVKGWILDLFTWDFLDHGEFLKTIINMKRRLYKARWIMALILPSSSKQNINLSSCLTR